MCNCGKNEICINSNKENFCKGLVSQSRLSKEAMQQIKEMIKERFDKIEQRVEVKVLEYQSAKNAISLSQTVGKKYSERARSGRL